MKDDWEARTSYKLEDLPLKGFVWEKPLDNEPNYDWLSPLLKWSKNESPKEKTS